MRKLKKFIIFFLVMFVSAPMTSSADDSEEIWENCAGSENNTGPYVDYRNGIEMYTDRTEIIAGDITKVPEECKGVTIRNDDKKIGCETLTAIHDVCARYPDRPMDYGVNCVVDLKLSYRARCCKEQKSGKFRWKGLRKLCSGVSPELTNSISIANGTLVHQERGCWDYSCNSGYEKNDDKDGCIIDCPDGQEPNSAGTGCECIDTNKYLIDGECKACPAGQELKRGACVCTDEKEYLSASGSCEACGAGQVQNDAGTACVCTDEKKYLDDNECKACPAGKVQNAEGTGCGNKKIQRDDFEECVNKAAAATAEAFKACLERKAIVS